MKYDSVEKKCNVCEHPGAAGKTISVLRTVQLVPHTATIYYTSTIRVHMIGRGKGKVYEDDLKEQETM